MEIACAAHFGYTGLRSSPATLPIYSTTRHRSATLSGSGTSGLGERNLAGHDCRGYSPNGKSSGGAKLSEVWFDKETGALIGETSPDMQINLLEFKTTPPPPALFTFPPDRQMSTSPVL